MRGLLLATLLVMGCSDKDDSDTEPDTDTGTDSEAGTDADTEPDTDADTEPPYTGSLRIFKSTRVAPDFGGPAGADALCNADDNNPDPRSDYKALLVGGGRVACGEPDCANDAAGQSDWVLYADEPYVLEDGTALFTTNADAVFTAWPMENAIESAGWNFWAGMRRDWTAYGDSQCDNWTSNSAELEGRVGWTQSTGSGLIEGGFYNCDTPRTSLLCVEQ